MIQYLLVEDEHFAAEEIRRMIQKLRPDYQMVGQTDSVDGTISFLRHISVDLIILDIRLSDGISFEIFEQVSTDIPILFTTAYDEYALQAFKVNSVHYLLKPVEEAELETALYRFEQNSHVHPTSAQYKKLEKSLREHNKKNRFLVQTGDTYQYVETGEIAFFYSEEKYVFLHTFTDKRYIVNYTLEQLEQMLDERIFFRVARNCIANIKAISKISKYFAGRLKLNFVPKCPHEALVSRNRVTDFLKWVDDIPY